MPMSSHASSSNPLNAQALWDASMAYAISNFLMRQPNALVLHMVGAFHVERGTGTPEHLNRYRPGTASMIVVIRPVENVEAFDPERDGEGESFIDRINPGSLESLYPCYLEPALSERKVGESCQFERIGYFCADADGTQERPVFNRTVGLRDAWARIQKKKQP